MQQYLVRIVLFTDQIVKPVDGVTLVHDENPCLVRLD